MYDLSSSSAELSKRGRSFKSLQKLRINNTKTIIYCFAGGRWFEWAVKTENIKNMSSSMYVKFEQ